MKTDVKLPEENTGIELPNVGLTLDEPVTPKESKPVHLDFNSPFQKADMLEKRLKLFLWGDTGVGKTTLALQFPDPVMIDLEGGADLYGNSFRFSVLRAKTCNEVMSAVDWLLQNKHEYRTLIIDPITIYWDALQKKWSDIFLLRNKGTKGFKYEFYDMQVKDWLTIKSEHKEFLRKLIALDMNVILTAREKTKYKDGGFMQSVGETFDGEKSLPYVFDTIVQMYIGADGKRLACCKKDRSNKLPAGEFECSYAVFEKAFSKKELTKEAKSIQLITSEQVKKIHQYFLKYKIKEQVSKRLAAYEVESVEELSYNNAVIIIQKLQEHENKKGGK